MMVRIRLLLLVAGLSAFGVAIRTGIEWLRWVGIALAAIALLLRFAPRSSGKP
jgi:cytochrome b